MGIPGTIYGIRDSSCIIGNNVIFGEYCEVRPRCRIGDNTRLGSRCTLAAGTIIGRNCDLKYGFVATDTPKVGQKERTPCIIGDNVKAGANVTIMPGVRVGNNVTIGAGSTVRHDIPDGETWWGNPAGPRGIRIEDGAQQVNGVFIKSKGGVKVHHTVYAQSHVSVKRGLWENTYTEIGENTYICSFVNIGHNVKIGKECFLATRAALLGNVEIGNNVYVGAGATVTQDRKIGRWVKIRAGEVVDFDVPSYTYVGKNGVMKPNKHAPWVHTCIDHLPKKYSQSYEHMEGKCKYCAKDAWYITL